MSDTYPWQSVAGEAPEAISMRYIEALRSDYGASVIIFCDDEEANHKNLQTAIEVSARWTGFQQLRFYGENVMQCLATAMEAKTASDNLAEIVKKLMPMEIERLTGWQGPGGAAYNVTSVVLCKQGLLNSDWSVSALGKAVVNYIKDQGQ